MGEIGIESYNFLTRSKLYIRDLISFIYNEWPTGDVSCRFIMLANYTILK